MLRHRPLISHYTHGRQRIKELPAAQKKKPKKIKVAWSLVWDRLEGNSKVVILKFNHSLSQVQFSWTLSRQAGQCTSHAPILDLLMT